MEEFINIEHVNFSYYAGNCLDFILKDINLKIKKGEFISIIGPNGCGKSTLVKHLNAILLPTEGKVFVEKTSTANEENKKDIRCKVGLAFQNPDNQIIESTVEEDVAFGPENLGLDPIEIRKKVESALKLTNMYEYRKSDICELSVYQKQKTVIAGIIAMGVKCIVLDELTSMLDYESRKDLINILKRLKEELNITVIFITHYMDEAAKADRVIVMNDGSIVLDNTPRKVFSNIETLEKINLNIPVFELLIYKLKQAGEKVPESVLTEEECIEAIEKLLEAKKCQ